MTRAAARAQAGQETAASLRELVHAELAMTGRETEAAGFRLAARQAAVAVAELEEARRERPGRIEEAEGRLGEARSAASTLAASRQQQAEVDRLVGAARRLAELEPVIKLKAGALRAAVDSAPASRR